MPAWFMDFNQSRKSAPAFSKDLAMPQQTNRPAITGKTILWFLVELAAYALFVLAYYLAVLHFWRDWLKQLYDQDRLLYALATLGLIIGQALVLELVTAALRRFTRRPSR